MACLKELQSSSKFGPSVTMINLVMEWRRIDLTTRCRSSELSPIVATMTVTSEAVYFGFGGMREGLYRILPTMLERTRT